MRSCLPAAVFATCVWLSPTSQGLASNNDLVIEQVGGDNTATVRQGKLTEAKTFGGNFFEGDFVPPFLKVETPAGEVVEMPIPANPQACENSQVIVCEEGPIPSGPIVVPPGDADNSRAHILQDGDGNDAVTRQYGDGSRSVLVQGSVSALEATNLAGISRNRTFQFADSTANAPSNGGPGNGDQRQGNGAGAGANSNAVGGNGDFEPLTGEQTLGDVLDSLNGQGAVTNNTARVVQGGGGNKSLALQAGDGSNLVTVQNGNDVGVHLQTNGDNNTRLLQGDGANENALIARGDVYVSGQADTPFTVTAQDGVNFAVDLKGPQDFSGVFARPNGAGGLNIRVQP